MISFVSWPAEGIQMDSKNKYFSGSDQLRILSKAFMSGSIGVEHSLRLA
tara:strand:+ start:360 stop:506 length:147 start_codon:yes stop_codon:yes gene_type:complete